jgi:thioredoxin-related protein
MQVVILLHVILIAVFQLCFNENCLNLKKKKKSISECQKYVASIYHKKECMYYKICSYHIS